MRLLTQGSGSSRNNGLSLICYYSPSSFDSVSQLVGSQQMFVDLKKIVTHYSSGMRLSHQHPLLVTSFFFTSISFLFLFISFTVLVSLFSTSLFNFYTLVTSTQLPSYTSCIRLLSGRGKTVSVMNYKMSLRWFIKVTKIEIS